MHRGGEELVAAVGAQAQHGERPGEHGALHARERPHREGLGHLGAHHGELVRAALEVVVREDGAAHDGEVGVGADEVVGEQVDEVEQAAKRLLVDVHRAVVRAHRDAVLVEVGVGGVLEAPALAVKLHGDDAQVLAGGVLAAGRRRAAPGVALVLDAELAGRVLLARRLGRARRGDVARVLLGLGEVDRDLEVAPAGGGAPLDVARDGGAAHVAGVAADAVEPVGRRPGALVGEKPLKGGDRLGGTRHERAHDAHGDAVAPARGVLDLAVLDGEVGEGGERRLEVELGLAARSLREHPVLVGAGPERPDGLERCVVGPDAVGPADEPARGRVVYERLDTGADVRGVYSHCAYAPLSAIE